MRQTQQVLQETAQLPCILARQGYLGCSAFLPLPVEHCGKDGTPLRQTGVCVIRTSTWGGTATCDKTILWALSGWPLLASNVTSLNVPRWKKE